MEGWELATVKFDDKESFSLLGNRILLELDNEKEYAEINGRRTGIIVPEKYKKWVYYGTIRAIGTDVLPDEYGIKRDDRVLFSSVLKGVDLTINGLKYKILNPTDLEAIAVSETEIKPLGNRVVIMPIEEPVKSSIIIPETIKINTTKGTVKTIGDVLYTKQNDEIIFSKFAGVEVHINEQKHIIIKEDDIFFIVGKEA